MEWQSTDQTARVKTKGFQNSGCYLAIQPVTSATLLNMGNSFFTDIWSDQREWSNEKPGFCALKMQLTLVLIRDSVKICLFWNCSSPTLLPSSEHKAEMSCVWLQHSRLYHALFFLGHLVGPADHIHLATWQHGSVVLSPKVKIHIRGKMSYQKAWFRSRISWLPSKPILWHYKVQTICLLMGDKR